MSLINKIFIGIGAALMLIVAIAILWLWLVDAHLRVQLATAQADSAACHLANDTFADEVAKQNKEVEAIRKNAEAHRARARLESLQAQVAARHWLEAAAKISNQKIAGDQCRVAGKLIDEYLDQK